MWAIHAAVMGTDPQVTDRMTDSHGDFSVSILGLEVYFEANSFATLLKNRLAYACEQGYVIDPTGFSIQTMNTFPNCGYSEVAV